MNISLFGVVTLLVESSNGKEMESFQKMDLRSVGTLCARLKTRFPTVMVAPALAAFERVPRHSRTSSENCLTPPDHPRFDNARSRS